MSWGGILSGDLTSIFQINRKRIFSLDEIQSLLPIILKITDESSREVNAMMARLESLPNRSSALGKTLEIEIERAVEVWQSKIVKLGGDPKGIWLADFDKGDGYWCWKYPENKISHWHGYQDGFSGRMMVSTNTVEKHENISSPN